MGVLEAVQESNVAMNVEVTELRRAHQLLTQDVKFLASCGKTEDLPAPTVPEVIQHIHPT